jgi:aromatic-L-amino-acid decarboxylase
MICISMSMLFKGQTERAEELDVTGSRIWPASGSSIEQTADKEAPMDDNEFRVWSHKAADWGVNYRQGLRNRPVRAQTVPGATFNAIPPSAPESPEPMDTIFADFEKIVMPGITHWQHPRFFAYFPANAAPASAIAEQFVSAIAAQCMLWQTSPSATELETRVLDWLRRALGLPEGFEGVIQDSASSATLAAVSRHARARTEMVRQQAGTVGSTAIADLQFGSGAHLD